MCPLCQSDLIANFSESPKYQQCQRCQFLFMRPEFLLSSELEKLRYQQHENHVEDVGYQNFVTPLCDLILKSVKPHLSGLDYGCGPGPVVTYLLSKQGYKIDLYDPFFKPNDEVFKLKYDFIFACEVVEHFYHPFLEFQTLIDLLKPQANLFIQTQFYHSGLNFKSWSYKNDPTHVGFFSEPCWEWLAQFFSLQIKYMDRKSGLIQLQKV